MNELFALYKRNFPFCVREERKVKQLLNDPENVVVERRSADGNLIAASVIQENNILMLCVDEAFRRRGIGSGLLSETENRIRENGYASVSVGAGREYIMPGVPVNRPVIRERMEAECPIVGVDETAMRFFEERGYSHSWDCNCFDMRFELDEFRMPEFVDDGMEYRWAEEEDRLKVLECVENGFSKFVRFYGDDGIYRSDSDRRALIAVDGTRTVGALIVAQEAEGERTGSVGCTVVREECRGRGIASRLVAYGTQSLKRAGMQSAFLGYTYSGLDKLYGRCGYRICMYYYMARKNLYI